MSKRVSRSTPHNVLTFDQSRSRRFLCLRSKSIVLRISLLANSSSNSPLMTVLSSLVRVHDIAPRPRTVLVATACDRLPPNPAGVPTSRLGGGKNALTTGRMTSRPQSWEALPAYRIGGAWETCVSAHTRIRHDFDCPRGRSNARHSGLEARKCWLNTGGHRPNIR